MMERENYQPVRMDSSPHIHEEPMMAPKKGKPTRVEVVEYTGAKKPLQVRLPADLCDSLKLHAIKDDKSISDIVLECLTSKKMVGKAHVRVMGAA